MPARPDVVAFDALGTVANVDALEARLKDFNLMTGSVRLWFASALRDGFALAAAGQYRPYREVASAALVTLMRQQGVEATPEDAWQVLQGLPEAPIFPDVEPAFRLVQEQGVKAIILTNGSAETAERGLRNNRVRDLVDRIVSVDEVQCWKPDRRVYEHAAQVMGVDAARMALVSAHGWDIMGARQAGWTTGWVSRVERVFPSIMGHPDVEGADLVEVVQHLLGAEAGRRREAA